MRVFLCLSYCLMLFGMAAVVGGAEDRPVIEGIPEPLTWKNAPAAWHIEKQRTLTVSSGPKTDWFVDPFDGKVSKSAPILLFTPAENFVLSARVRVRFKSKWDAGALMLWADDHHWVKLAFELSPDEKPILVTVVTRGESDDANASSVAGDSVYLQIARSGPTYVLYSSMDGRKWSILRTFRLETDLKVQVGFESQSPDGSGSEAVFTDVRYTPEKIKNIYTGQ
jgi:regulation of enolase protein 1 (concanavalin A-like superfamily)